ncbi:MAG: hypothetical protein KME60_24200 [Cyanomargarita calcarea GSE-NOS-MK-12-04C]|uniref:Uncharacterized protein n=1 Tax=Cyanomargarita calcarea GSE-NOS-MK-12-04C TaxID=2839659 RepID=A0A951QR10_9CYAN|nr:hypothetical protein [Cyanomargarita calcarea GSE-NOS-MK-12-04C]
MTKGTVVTTTNKVVTTTETTKGTTVETESTATNGVVSKISSASSKVSKEALDSLKLTDEYFNPPSVAQSANSGTPTDASGLPRQPIGAIDLADGRAEGIAVADEAKRIKGYESNASVITTPQILTLAPGSIIGISGNLVPPPFDREWRVSSVRHKFPGGVTEIQFYTPQAAPPQATVTVANTATTDSSPVQPGSQMPGGWIMPCAGRTGDGYGSRPGRSPGYMHRILDIANNLNTPIVAMNDGVVEDVVGHCRVGDKRCGGGWGNHTATQPLRWMRPFPQLAAPYISNFLMVTPTMECGLV